MAKGGFTTYSGSALNFIRGTGFIGTDSNLIAIGPGMKIRGQGSASQPARR